MKVEVNTQIEEDNQKEFEQGFIKRTLQNIDMYGRTVNFSIEGDADTIKDPFGGCMTLIFLLLTTAYLCNEMLVMYSLE